MWICLFYFIISGYLMFSCWLKINIEWKTSVLYAGWPWWIYVAGIPCFTVLHFIMLCVFFFFSKKYYSFRNRRLVATLGWGSLWAPFSRTLAHFLFLFHFDNSHIISDFFIIIIFVVVICDQWSFSNKSIVDLWYCVSFRCTT